MNANPHTAHPIIAVVAALILAALPVSAQERPAPALDLSAGWVGFADDFLARRNGIPRISPFVVVGGGLFRTSEEFANRPPFSATEGASTLGGGIRAPLTERVSAGIDGRLWWEPHLRLTGFVSVDLGRKP